MIEALETYGKLEEPHGKKLDNELFEIRVKVKGIWRCIYSYIKDNQIVALHIFMKKTQKTPLDSIKTAKRRLIKFYK